MSLEGWILFLHVASSHSHTLTHFVILPSALHFLPSLSLSKKFNAYADQGRYKKNYLISAPQEVTQLMVDVVSDSSIQVQWGPPARSNGILTHYTVNVFNQLTGYIFSSQVNPMDTEVITVQNLSK